MKTMRKMFAAACTAAFVLASCQEESFEGRPDPDNYYAAVETFGTDTRTALGEGHSVVWSSEDRIAIFEGNGSGQAYQVLDAYVGKSSGEFAEVEGLVAEGTGASLEGTIAVYPFNEDLTVTSGDNGNYIIEGITFPSEQKYIAGSFSDEAFPMTAICENGSRNLSFKNIGGVLKLSLTGNYSVSQITLTGNSGELLSGPATVNLGPDGIPLVTMSDDASTSVSLICDPSVQLDPETATDFYISIPPTDFENGFTVSVSVSNGEISEYSTGKRNQVSRSHILKMPTKPFIPNENEDYIKLQKDVISYEPDYNNYITVIDENTLLLSSDIPEEQIPEVGTIIYYDSERADIGVFIGKVVSITEDDNGYIIQTEIPDIEEVIEDISINLKMDSSNTIAQITPVEDDNITSCKVVDNSVWDNLQVIYEDKVVTRSTQSDNSRFPINVTLELNADANDIFEGKIYLGIEGWAKLEGTSSFIMEANVRIGLNGMLGVGISGDKKVTKPILKLKHGVTLYNNKILAIRLFPRLVFFINGKIQLEAGLNYEIMNTDIKYYCSDNNFHNNAVEQLHDNYFRVHSLHSEGEFGFELENKIYAFIFSDKFFNAGISMSAGLGIKGENNVGIQFPDFANFDFSVVGTPYLEMYPFFAYRSIGGLKNIKGPTFSVSSEAFKIPLLPDIHEINYEIRNNKRKLAVAGSINGQNTSFIESKQEGIALFKKGEEKPVAHQSISRVDTKASTGELSFDLIEGASYEIAPYVESFNNGYVYGERIPITQSLRDQLIDFYYATGGPNWTNNDNWCSDRPIEEWYGIQGYYYDDRYSINLTNNNLVGNVALNNQGVININVSGNLLMSLDLSGCTALTSVDCYENQLTSLDLSGCTALTSVNCVNNQLTSLDLSGCTALEDVRCYDNQLTSLDLSGYTALESVHCDNNQLTSLDLSGCTALESVNCDNNPLRNINLKNCTSLGHFSVLSVETKKITGTLNLSGCTALTSVDCTYNQLTSLDLSGCTALEDVRCAYNQLTSLDLSGCTALTSVDCVNNQLTSLDLSGCTALESVNCDNNPLRNINLKNCTSLGHFSVLSVETKKITGTLNLSGCTALTSVGCAYNQLTSLDLSGCTALTSVGCAYNQLTSLDLSGCTALTSVDCVNNQLTSLDLSGCTALESVNCDNNPLRNINLKNCTSLGHFSVHSDETKKITGTLNLSGCTALTYVDCVINQLTSLDLSGCTALTSVDCYENQLTSLDLSGCTALTSVGCFYNQLTSLDLSGYTALESVHCFYNQLTSLDLSGCTALESVSCENNQLTSLDISGCTALRNVYCKNNRISQVITPEFERVLASFDVRYTNYWHTWFEGGGCDFGYTDNKIGWWHPGEPESEHSRWH